MNDDTGCLYKIALLQSLLHVSSYIYKAVITLPNTVMVLSSNSHTKLSMNENEIENAIFPLFLPRTIRCGGDRAQPTAAIHNVLLYNVYAAAIVCLDSYNLDK